MGSYLGLAAGAALCLMAVGCGADEDPAPLGTGLLTVEWSILSGFDPGACFTFGADAMELVVFDDFGVVTEVEAPCEDFVVTVELIDGLYSADVTLVDVDDFAVTTTQTLDALDVITSSELVVEIDFPSGSFVAGPL